MMDYGKDMPLGGGIMKVPDESGLLQPGRGGSCVSFLVEDLKKTAEAIEKAGGKVLSGPIKESASGLYQYFEDTEGNMGNFYQFVGSPGCP
jgi:predicted enzyme related to lactoylglutathione lyase